MFNIKHDPFHNIPLKKKMRTLKITLKKKKEMGLSEDDIHKEYFLKSQLYNFLKELNDDQLDIVLHKEGSIMCSAVPGSGKTKTLVYKVAYLIEHCNVDPNRILVITFTKESAEQIKNRIKNILSESHENDIFSGTFHSVCYRFLKEQNILSNHTHIDEESQKSILKLLASHLYNEDNQKSIDVVLRKLMNSISHAKNNYLTPEECLKISKDETFYNVYKKYNEYLNSHKNIDFDDLLLKMVVEIKENEIFREIIKNRFDYVFVDEFQDTNMLQFDIVECFANKTNNITIVGDSDQSIYEWRYADSENVQKFAESFPSYTTYLLNHSYRSTKRIINCYNSVIQQESNRINGDIITTNDIGQKVSLIEFETPDKEATSIAKRVSDLYNIDNVPLSNIAILLRTNYQYAAIEKALIKLNVPHQLIGTKNFYEGDEIQFILSYLKFIANTKDVMSFGIISNMFSSKKSKSSNRIESAGWNEFKKQSQKKRISKIIKIIDKCDDMIVKNNTISDIINYIINKIKYQNILSDYYDDAEEKWKNLEELLSLGSSYVSIELFLIDIASSLSGYDSSRDNLDNNYVSILTIHSAKGLEWDNVFIPSVVETIIPHSRSIGSINDEDADKKISEERRLLYVAMSRAKQKLFMSYCRTLNLFGRSMNVKMSRFLNNLPLEDVDHVIF